MRPPPADAAPAAGAPARPARASRIAYQPALDGLRAMAILTIMLYHGEVSWPRGGYLSVDLFFVLSGYLITTLLLAEWEARATIDLKRFWSGRARRLLPALFLMLGGIAAYAALLAPATGLARMRGDALATLLYVANWRFAFTHLSYFEQFGDSSPLTHMWTLGIEEQYYLLWPLLLIAGLRLARGRLRPLLVGTLLALCASALTMAALYRPGDAPADPRHRPVDVPGRLHHGRGRLRPDGDGGRPAGWLGKADLLDPAAAGDRADLLRPVPVALAAVRGDLPRAGPPPRRLAAGAADGRHLRGRDPLLPPGRAADPPRRAASPALGAAGHRRRGRGDRRPAGGDHRAGAGAGGGGGRAQRRHRRGGPAHRHPLAHHGDTVTRPAGQQAEPWQCLPGLPGRRLGRLHPRLLLPQGDGSRADPLTRHGARLRSGARSHRPGRQRAAGRPQVHHLADALARQDRRLPSRRHPDDARGLGGARPPGRRSRAGARHPGVRAVPGQRAAA